MNWIMWEAIEIKQSWSLHPSWLLQLPSPNY
jgi:hypothetical protein